MKVKGYTTSSGKRVRGHTRTDSVTRSMRKQMSKGSREMRLDRIFGVINYHLAVGSRTPGKESSYFRWRNRRSKLINGLARQARQRGY